MPKGLDDYEACIEAFNAFMNASATILSRVTQVLEDRFSLSMNEFDALACLDPGPEDSHPLTKICEAVPLSQPAISRLADRLEHRGLIERQPGLEDRRNIRIRLTASGRTLIHHAKPIYAAAVHEVLIRRLTSREREAFGRILMKLAATNNDDGGN